MRTTKRTHQTRHVTTFKNVRANGRPNRPSLTLEPRQVPFEKPQLQRTPSVWPSSVRRHAPDSASQTSVAYPLFAPLSAKLKPQDTNFALIILPGQVLHFTETRYYPELNGRLNKFKNVSHELINTINWSQTSVAPSTFSFFAPLSAKPKPQDTNLRTSQTSQHKSHSSSAVRRSAKKKQPHVSNGRQDCASSHHRSSR